MPANSPSIGQGLLIRAGYLRFWEGKIAYLPLGQRVLTALQRLLDEEMNHLGAQQVTLPLSVTPNPLSVAPIPWKTLEGIWDSTESETSLAPTHFRTIQTLAQRDLQTYRQLPCTLYTYTHLAAAPWERLAPLRLTQALVLESFALTGASSALEGVQRRYLQAAWNVLHRLGIPVRWAQAGPPDSLTPQMLWVPHPQGDLAILSCPQGDYAALEAFATYAKPEPIPEPLLPLEPIPTPGVQTIRDLAGFLNLPEARLAKAVFYLAQTKEEAEEFLVLALVRGDRTLSEAKLAAALGAHRLRPASPEAITAIGAVPGYASPIGLKEGVRILVDDLIPHSPNLVAGANRPDTHMRHVNFGRDFSADQVTDLTLAQDGDPCPHCRAPLERHMGLPVAWLGALGALETVTFLEEDGQPHPLYGGYFRLNLEAVLLALAEQHHDPQGLKWPVILAPFAVHLIALGGRKAPRVIEEAERLYGLLQAAGVSVLYDDRDTSPGVKFNDADLIGLPLRLTLSPRTLETAAVEAKWRGEAESQIIPLAEVLEWVPRRLAERSTPPRRREFTA
ncbi:YbaK/EbsC family protein [uncultured Thermanaerothrix sp.]|uniref:proline--tRNA ligase n=1 Tax=uncultured Thermanaerothrix sp. TaxID=1195149 RepID=UPI00262B5877|nr:YbaK/EbsC family protein [uncultured Thermanaerothrix sp.]